jgi:hypothetical protein
LINIKAFRGLIEIMGLQSNRKEQLMPTDLIVVVAMAIAFGVFAATLYWADLQTRGLQ